MPRSLIFSTSIILLLVLYIGLLLLLLSPSEAGATGCPIEDKSPPSSRSRGSSRARDSPKSKPPTPPKEGEPAPSPIGKPKAIVSPSGQSAAAGGVSLTNFLGAVALSWTMNLKGLASKDVHSAVVWGGNIKGSVTNFGGFTMDPLGSGVSTLKINYPAGSWSPSAPTRGGTSFYAPVGGGASFRKAILQYSVYFPTAFDFVKGGKLPGLWGGDVNQKCSGGSHAGGCWSMRIMWRKDGAGEAYSYLPSVNDAVLCDKSRYSNNFCNPSYGNSLNRGSWQFATGQWTQLAMLVQMNDIGRENGGFELWANGKSVMSYQDLVYRIDAKVGVNNLFFSTFFGGADSSWASPRDTYALFKDMTVNFAN
ncbi:hypothetical protein SeLEV6574_g03611 [Synchytrium endobioticum]|uniref:Polysaccharide lyase 14 domain-containing protein n=1 Tax=Synchytrium endobioticum TaxID=286115 RepID=A0A507D2Y4_9FUNG|nr:hypothetical protein SeLEV6574_g03611 [Synchytrium endobioticum]